MRQRVSATVTRPIKDRLRIYMEREDMSESMAVRELLAKALEAEFGTDANREKAA